jgi:hypothetical protein
MDRVLALDLGTKTGWAICNGKERSWGEWNLADHSSVLEAKLDVFARLLTRDITEHQIETLVVEEPYIGGKDGQRAARLLMGFLTLASLTAYRRNLRFQAYRPDQIKMATIMWCRRKSPATGRVEQAKASHVLASLQERGVEIWDENAGIALAALMLYRAELRAYVPAKAEQAEIVPKAKRAGSSRILIPRGAKVRARGRIKS